MENFSYNSAPWQSNHGTIKNVYIKQEVIRIGNYAFYDCDLLASINIPGSVTSIGDSAFAGCRSLTSINIPGSVASIEFCAFLECTALTTVIIGDGVTSIGEYAFQECYSLTSINIPDSMTSIGLDAFQYCRNLTAAYYPGTEEEWNRNVYVKSGNKSLIDHLIFGVTFVPVAGVTLSAESLTLAPGEGAQLAASVIPENATNQTLRWESGSARVAMVDENGNVTALDEGIAVITVTTVEGGYTASCTVTVSAGDDPAPNVLVGDVNGDAVVDAKDRTMMARALAEWDGYTVDPVAADVNRNGKFTSIDRTILARALAGWEGYSLG